MTRTPYFEALRDYVEAGVLPFHMPGHQQGRGAPLAMQQFFREHALAGDITQVLGMDDIHRPDSVCGEAQALAARAWGAEYTYFLVNGSTCGNQAALMATLQPQDTVLIPRNAHRSAMGGVLLAGARPCYYHCPFDEEMGVYHAPTLACLPEQPARVLFLTSPTYYGACSDLPPLVEWAHQRDMVVIVDEAWGPHLKFHPDLPSSALEAGADLVIQSTHKLLSGLSQASMLHLQGDRVDRGRLESILRLLQTTSPNCLLLASLDLARQQMQQDGQALLQKALDLSFGLRHRLREFPAIHCFAQRTPLWDPTRVVFRVGGHSGYEAEKALRQRHKIQMEMSDRHNVVGLITLGHEQGDLDRLIEALSQLGQGQFPPQRAPLPHRPLPPQSMTLRQAFDAPWESVPLGQAEGRTCVEPLCPYPPGIAWVMPGEVLTRGMIEELQAELAAGVTIQGAFDLNLKTVRVAKV